MLTGIRSKVLDVIWSFRYGWGAAGVEGADGVAAGAGVDEGEAVEDGAADAAPLLAVGSPAGAYACAVPNVSDVIVTPAPVAASFTWRVKPAVSAFPGTDFRSAASSAFERPSSRNSASSFRKTSRLLAFVASIVVRCASAAEAEASCGCTPTNQPPAIRTTAASAAR